MNVNGGNSMLNRDKKGKFVKGHKSGMTNKKHSFKTRKKMSLYVGEARWNYKGAITTLNKRIYDSYKYRQWRSDIFTRDNFICKKCGVRGEYIEAHHLKEFSKIMAENKIDTLRKAMNCEELWNINNGLTLCGKCHNLTKKGNPNWGRNFGYKKEN